MYLDSDSIGARFTTEFRDAMSPGAGLASAITGAQSVVEQALRQGGYSAAVPATTYASVAVCPTQIHEAALGAWWTLAHTTRGIPLPNPLPENMRQMTDMIAAITAGTLAIEGVAVDTARAVGGVAFTESRDGVSGARPQVFGRESMVDY